MNSDETTAVLRIRRDLTGESFNDGTVSAWCMALTLWPMPAVRTAVVGAAREHHRVTVAHVVDRLPDHHREAPPPPDRCELCDGSGFASLTPERAHNPRVCHPTTERPCACTGVVPCRCSTGRRMVDVHRRIIEHNDRQRPNDDTTPRLQTTPPEQDRLDL